MQIRRAVAGTAAAVSRAGLWLSMLALVGILVIVVFAVMGRYLGLWTILGADELSGYGLVALVFFGFAHTFRAGGFIRVDTFLKRTRGWGRRVLEVLLHLVALAFVLLLGVYLWRFVADSYRFQVTSIGLLRVPLYVPQAVVVVGAAALALQTLANLLERLLAPLGEEVGPARGPSEI
ncbi:MAG: TRAP transporter small permease [Candidatus Rokubacteria bacterium]|nr:TRAP transporter small permease [Candidatus Rokubacteria bacterium]